MKRLKEHSLTIYIIINILYILIGCYLHISGMNLIIYSKILTTIFLLTNVLIIVDNRKKYKKNKIDIFLILIVIFAIIATIFAFDVGTAISGGYNRYEGLYMIIYYMTILYICSYVKKEDKKYIVYTILFSGIIQTLYAICQKTGIFNVITVIHNNQRWSTGFVKNPNFLGTHMLICLSLSIGLFFDEKNNRKNIIYLLLIILFVIGMLISDTLSVVIGLFTILLFLLIYSVRNKKIKKLLLLSSIILVSTYLLSILNLTSIPNDLNVFKNETTSIVKREKVDKNSYGTGRIFIWKETIKFVPKYLIHGVGVDNFYYINNGKPIRRKNELCDKAHNEYLQILVTMGIFSLISYLFLYYSILKEGLKNSIKNKETYLILPIIGYLVQAFFNISVIQVAPLFYIILGLCIDR